MPSAPEPARKRFFPIGGKAAIARGYRIPEPFGLGVLLVSNVNNFDSKNLEATVAKGAPPAEDADLIPLPTVTTRRLEGDTAMYGFKADLWLFPGVNVFASIGKVKGTNSIDIDIDLDATFPFPICRPAKPCGTLQLPVETRIDNTTVTVGTILVYGSEKWFVLGTVAKTVSISSKERSDVKSTNLGFRGGPRFQVGADSYISPYVGVNYFDMHTTVKGLVESGPVFEDGDNIALRYKVDMRASEPWALVMGGNVEITRHISFQAELQAGKDSTRTLATASLRF